MVIAGMPLEKFLPGARFEGYFRVAMKKDTDKVKFWSSSTIFLDLYTSCNPF